MADNVAITAGAGTVIATDDIGGVHYQRVKVAFGLDDAATMVSASNGLPINVVATITLPVSAASLPLPTGAATETTLSTLNGKIIACNTGAVVLATGGNVIGAVTQSGTWSVRNQDGSGNNLTSRLVGSVRAQDVALVDASGNQIGVSGVPVRVDPTGTTAQPVTDNAGSLTVDAPVGTPVFVRLSDGTSAIATLPVSLASLPALVAGTAMIGQVAATQQTGQIYSGTTALTVKYAVINTAASGVSTVVAGVATKKIRVLSYRFQADADVSVKFRDNTAAVDLTGAMATGAKGGGGGAAFSPVGHFETAAGNALSINLSAAVQVSGHVAYVEV